MKQEIFHLLKIILIGLCCKEIAGHRRPNRHAYDPFPPLPYFHNNKFYLPPRPHPHHHPQPRPRPPPPNPEAEPFPFKNSHIYSPPPSPPTFNENFPPYQQLPGHSPLQYQSPEFPFFFHENIIQPPPFIQNVPLYFPLQNFQDDFNQNHLGYVYQYDPSPEKNQHNEIINIKAPIQIIPSRFPPRIEQIIERIQNYFSTYSQVEGQRPDYDPNIKPPLTYPQTPESPPAQTLEPPTQTPNNTNIGNRIGNTTEEPMTTTTERAEETTPKDDDQPVDVGDVEIIFANTTEDADADGSSEIEIEVANKMGNSTEEAGANEEEEQATEANEPTETTEQENGEEESTTDNNNEENSTENDLEIHVISIKRKNNKDNR